MFCHFTGCNFNKVLIEAFLKDVIQFYAVEFRIFSPLSSHPLRLQDDLAMHSVLLAMGSVRQKKFASALRV